MQLRRYIQLTYLTVLIIALWHCANPVTPEGGPKDVKPPKILSCDPPDQSTGFKGNTIRIEFDEFIVVKNPSSEILISPPVKNTPDYRLRGKSLIIKLDDTLTANTTYTINFGKSIADITENNVLTGLTYVFSTGDHVDSLSLAGHVIGAFNLKPQKEVFTILYVDNNDTVPFDSLPLKVPPMFIVRTKENGEFLFTNLKEAPYKLIALNDQNSNLFFDQPSEKVAFLDSLVHPVFIPPVAPDTVAKDTAGQKSSAKKDTSEVRPPLFPSYEMKLFEEIDSTQRLLRTRIVRDGMILFVLKYPAKKLRFHPVNIDSASAWKIEEYYPRRDSVVLWMTGKKTDSLIVGVSDNNTMLDTVKLDLRKKQIKKKTDNKDSTPERLGITCSAKNTSLNQFTSRLELAFSYPLSRWDFSRVLLIDEKDTLHPKMELADSINRKVVVRHKWKEDKQYMLIIPDSVFYGISNLTNDSLKQDFRTRSAREFGSLIVTLDILQRPGNYIIQLLSEKESLLEEQFVNASGKISFRYIQPGKYKIKAILDRNRNKQWDTGNYRNNLQPEDVFYLPKTIEIRANWDVEENWKL